MFIFLHNTPQCLFGHADLSSIEFVFTNEYCQYIIAKTVLLSRLLFVIYTVSSLRENVHYSLCIKVFFFSFLILITEWFYNTRNILIANILCILGRFDSDANEKSLQNIHVVH